MNLTPFLIQTLVLGLTCDDITTKYLLVKVDGASEIQSDGTRLEPRFPEGAGK